MSAQFNFTHGPSETDSRSLARPVVASGQEGARMQKSAAAAPVSHADLLDGIMRMLGHRIAVYAALRRTAVAAERGLSAGDLRVLDLIIELAPLHTGQLTRLSGLSSGNITGTVDRLEALGMIHRNRHPRDRRVTLLTPDPVRCAQLDARTAATRPVPDANTLRQVHAFLTHYLGDRRNDALRSVGHEQADAWTDFLTRRDA